MSERTPEQLERIRDFVAALRSGEYEQTSDQLGVVCDDNRKYYCCEGVATERYGAQLDYRVEWDADACALTIDDFSEYASDDFWRKMGLSVGDADGSISEFALVLPDGATTLDAGTNAVSYMSLNDDGFTFAQIADLIEWQFLPCGQVHG